MPAPEGSPFHRLSRTAAHRWWRPPLSLLLIAVGAVVATLAVLVPALVVVVVVAMGQDAGDPGAVGDPVTALLGNPVAYLALALGSLALLIPVVLLAAWLIERRPIGGLASVAGRLRLRWLALCAMVALAAQIVGVFGLYAGFAAAGPQQEQAMFAWVGWETFLPGAAVAVLLVPLQATAEEYVFRGWLLQAFGAYLRTPWPGIVLSALAFAALHGYGLVGFANVVLFGLVAGWLAVRTGGLEAPIALHVLHNVASILPAAAAGQLEQALRVTDVPPYALAGTAAEMGFFVVAVWLLARRRRIRRLS